MYLLLTKTQGNRYIKKVPSETRLSENQVSLNRENYRKLQNKYVLVRKSSIKTNMEHITKSNKSVSKFWLVETFH